MKATILYVEDDESLGFVTRDNLEIAGYQITHCTDGLEALEHIKNTTFDLCLLDVMLPEMDGFTLAKEIRKRDTHIPILFLTAKSLKEDRIHGLRLGADDYITKPFSIEELILKVEIFLRRSRNIGSTFDQIVLKIGQFELDYKNLSLMMGDDGRKLTQREADLLKFLIENKNQVVQRGMILEKIWGENDYFLGRSLDVFISRLRKYLKTDTTLKIENIHGVGFRLIG